MLFETLVRLNCHSQNRLLRLMAAQFLEKLYGCEIRCDQMSRSVRFAHHARGCTIVAAKICQNVVIFQNVTVGTNLRFNKATQQWENVGNPILCSHVVVADGAKILGPVVIGSHTVVAAGAIVTKDVPAYSLAYGVNQWKPLAPHFDLVFHVPMVNPDILVEANRRLIGDWEKTQK